MPDRSPNTTSRLAARLQRRREALRQRPRLYAAIVGIVVAFLAALAWPFTIAHLQSIAVLDLVANKPVPLLLRRVVAEPITTRDLTLPLPSGAVRARLYTPVHHPDAPAIVVLHGVHHLGMDEPRLVAFASAMASCGIRVLTPELPDIKDYHVGANSIATIGDSAAWLAQQSGNHPVGIMGLSFSGGLSLLAAASPEWRPSIKFVVTIGSQDEMSRVADFYLTGYDQLPDGSVETIKPHEYGALVLEYENLKDFVPAPADLEPIRAVLRAHLYEDHAGEIAATARLTPAQLALATQLMDTTSPATRKLLAAAETRHIQEMAGVSPHGHLATLTTPVYLLHGAGDNIIPSAETQWMEAELPSETLKAALISPVLSHLDMDGANPTFADQLRLVHFFALVLHAAESR
jgi:pimeloyl-ACP methyl ester carboxylesterase